MAPKFGKVSADKLSRYELKATIDMTGFTTLAPRDGFWDPDAAYFFQLECLRCGERTTKDVCVHPSPMEQCSYAVAAGRAAAYVREYCYPKCSNQAHVVRKCKMCYLRGSLEIVPGPGASITPDSSVLMLVDCIGYKPVRFCPDADWTATTTRGANIDMIFTDDTFKGHDDEVGAAVSVTDVVFTFHVTSCPKA